MALVTMQDGYGDERRIEQLWDEFILADREFAEAEMDRRSTAAPHIGSTMLERMVFDITIDLTEPWPMNDNDPYRRLGSLGLRHP